LNIILERENKFLDKDALSGKIDTIKSKVLLNVKTIEGKIEKPSNEYELFSIVELIEELNEILKDTQDKVAEHNRLVENQSEEINVLTKDIRRFFASKIQGDAEEFRRKKTHIERAYNGLDLSRNKKNTLIQKKRQRLRELEKSVTSITPTISVINDMLQSFGFLSFSLAESELPGYYKVIREDGSDARETLSEGEKTFLTFLYFYQRIKGSDGEKDTAESKIVVFDDPISSLDSNILFIVSTLIRGLIDEVITGSGYVKQIFILTHNIYFHKEVTFKYHTSKVSHWVVKKEEKKSQVSRCSCNPVKSSYELLWLEMKESNSITLRNLMRRILERYFSHFGDIGVSEIHEEFHGQDKLIFKSLVSWVHDGSHFIGEDLYVDVGSEMIENYKRVFKDVFYKKGHAAHYDMMMKEE